MGISTHDTVLACTQEVLGKLTSGELLQLANLHEMSEHLLTVLNYVEHQKREIFVVAGRRT